MTNFKIVFYVGFGILSTATSLALLSRFLLKPSVKFCSCNNRRKGKVIVITGGNSGIGYEVALNLAHNGAKIYICCRNETLGIEATERIIKISGNHSVYPLKLDLSNFNNCYQCAKRLLEAEPKIDVLIHNAAVFCNKPAITCDGFEVTHQTNFLSPVLLTEELFPLLFESPNPRIIFVNSEAHKIPSLNDVVKTNFRQIPNLTTFQHHIEHYGSSKAALKLYVTYLSLHYEGLSVVSVNPGNVWTRIYRNCWRQFYEWPFRLFCALLMKTPKEGAQSVLHAVNVEDLTSGCYIEDCQEKSISDKTEAGIANTFIDNIYKILNIKFED